MKARLECECGYKEESSSLPLVYQRLVVAMLETKHFVQNSMISVPGSNLILLPRHEMISTFTPETPEDVWELI